MISNEHRSWQLGDPATVGSTLVVLYLADGSEYQFKGPAQMHFRANRPEVSSGAPVLRRSAPSALQVRVDPGGVSQAAIVMRSLGGVRTRPLDGSATLVLDVQPELAWVAPLPDLRSSLDIADDAGRTLHKVELGDTRTRLPASVGLREGATYTGRCRRPRPTVVATAAVASLPWRPPACATKSLRRACRWTQQAGPQNGQPLPRRHRRNAAIRTQCSQMEQLARARRAHALQALKQGHVADCHASCAYRTSSAS